MEETVPENTTVTRPVPNEKPEVPQCIGVCNRPVSDSQDTKPADSARLARVQERTRVPADNPVTPGFLCLQATTGTVPNRIETLEENGAPETLKETVTPGPEQPTRPGGRRRADTETPDRHEPEFNSPWTLLPFAEATFRTTYQVRAVTSADDVYPRVQEVLDLPVLNLATVQGEDPDLVFIKELLQEHDVRHP